MTALLALLGAGAALLPSSFTGPGTAAESPEAAVAALVPGTGGGAPGTGAARSTAPTPAAPPPSLRPPAAAPTKTTSSPAAKKPASKKPAAKTSPAKQAATDDPPEADSSLAGQETEVIRLVNVERERAGCGAVKLNTKLRTAMRLHVQELGTHGDLYLSHVSDDGRDFVTRAEQQGYDDPGGENVARGQRDAADVMTGWMNSAGHRANIVNCDFKAIGVGAVKGVDDTIVWGQLFGRS